MSAVGTITQHGKTARRTIHYEQPSSSSDFHRIFAITADLHHETGIVPRLLTCAVEIRPDEIQSGVKGKVK